MNRHNKLIGALAAINAIAISLQNEPTITTRNYRTELDDSPVTINSLNSLNSGKRGKKGKSLKDWH